MLCFKGPLAQACRRASSSSAAREANEKLHTEYYIEREKKYGAHNYKPLPVVIARGKGS
jgi:ornithine--oxo-acid transaminase